jgi:hypothetical protein
VITLDVRSRTVCVGVALLSFAAAAARDPIAARPVPAAAPSPSPPLVATTQRFVEIVPRRDPFVGDPAATPVRSNPPLPAPPPPIPSAIVPLPPGTAIVPTQSAERVTAIVSGARRPFALVAAADRTRVVTVGDRVDGAPIVAISADGVRLRDGRTLRIGAEPSGPAAPRGTP